MHQIMQIQLVNETGYFATSIKVNNPKYFFSLKCNSAL